MPDQFDIAYEPGEILAAGSDTNADLTVTKVVGSASRARVLEVLIMANGAPAAGLVGEYRVGGVKQFDIPIPANSYVMIPLGFTQRGILHDTGDDVEVFVPAHGAGILVSVVIIGHLVGR